MQEDILYYPRRELAKSLIVSLNSGVTTAITLFAPRRMGKTQFLLQDIVPEAQAADLNVFYFSFMDETASNISEEFRRSLSIFAQNAQKTSGIKKFLGGITQVEFAGLGISREAKQIEPERISEIIACIANLPHSTLLLLDEVQELARISHTEGIIRSLRTGLDVHKNKVKVIFTGSSTNGLQAMFQNYKAPFFQFSHALDFPLLGKEFSDFLADIYYQRTQKQLDKDALYVLFQDMNSVPLYLRSLIQDMIINPNLSLAEAASYRLTQLNDKSQYLRQWQQFSLLEQLLIELILHGKKSLYSKEICDLIAEKLGVDKISPSKIQAALRKLSNQEIISKNNQSFLVINDALFAEWIKEQIQK
ncbi:MAG: AAA family ATPase [Cardiobacteriaceae bacterium]|nr:AAA family ATPase [Cardiobacteriaceae bacterium]